MKYLYRGTVIDGSELQPYIDPVPKIKAIFDAVNDAGLKISFDGVPVDLISEVGGLIDLKAPTGKFQVGHDVGDRRPFTLSFRYDDIVVLPSPNGKFLYKGEIIDGSELKGYPDKVLKLKAIVDALRAAGLTLTVVQKLDTTYTYQIHTCDAEGNLRNDRYRLHQVGPDPLIEADLTYSFSFTAKDVK